MASPATEPQNHSARGSMRWFVAGDWEGFFSVFINHLVLLLILVALCQGVVGFSSELIFGRILPGVAISFLIGNLFYAWEAMKLGRREGRGDACALSYGVNTPSLIAFVFLVMLPAKQLALAAGAPEPERVAWQAGLLACFASGSIELVGAFFVQYLLKITPRAAMLSTLSGIGLGFLGLGFALQTYANPVVGLATIAIVFIFYFGRMRFVGGIPGSLVVVVVGAALSWLIGIAPVGAIPSSSIGFYVPRPAIAETWLALTSGQLLPYLSVIIPMGLLSAISSLQNLESASAAGDDYPPRPSLIVNGLGTLGAACSGSPFPTSIFIGHPALKAIGARAGYSVMNGVMLAILCLTGTIGVIAWAIPPDAGLAIIVWVGVVITAQAFAVTPERHMTAVAVGMIPGLVAWTMLTVKTTLRAVGYGTSEGLSMSPALIDSTRANNLFLDGGFALEQGFIYSAMILSAMTVHIIDRDFVKASLWSLSAAVLSVLGLMHSWRFTPGDTVVHIPLVDYVTGTATSTSWQDLVPAWPFGVGYFLVFMLLVSTPWIARPDDGDLKT